MSTSLQEAAHDHSEHQGTAVVDEHAGHDHSQGTVGDAEATGGTAATMGMKAVDATDDEQKSGEN